jgi:uncharacterized protein (DUF1015 family)
MPKIKPFKAILPNPAKAKDVVIGLENLTISSAKELGGLNPISFVNLLVPKIENYYLRGSKQEIAFQKITENFEDFKVKGILIQDDNPAIYIYEFKNEYFHFKGFWTLSSIDDYLNNNIKKHELTRAEREKGLIEYLQQTGIDANPVLVTHQNNLVLNEIIRTETEKPTAISFTLENTLHQVWRIALPDLMEKVIDVFKEMPSSYIADGHHRAAAASTYGIERRKLNLKHRGNEEYNFFSSVYISSNQLGILPFHRFIKLDKDFDKILILPFLNQNFDIEEIDQNNLIPKERSLIGFYFDRKAYQINLKSIVNQDVLADLDVSLLQNHILNPLFNVTDSREDSRLHFLGGNIILEESLNQIDNDIFDLAFFLYPVLIEDLMSIADLGETMPPKSTWFEPKFLAGLITHHID